MKLKGKFKEDWLPIKDYESYYLISNIGNIKSIDRAVNHYKGGVRNAKGKTLKPYKNKTGYFYVDIQIKGIRKKFTIHRLVAEHFVSGYKDGLEVNHKDCDKTNNHYTNLEWVTRAVNTQHAYDNGLIDTSNRGGYRHGKRKVL